MQKRGQITGFILIGLILVIAVGVTYFILNIDLGEGPKPEFTLESLEQYVTSCLGVTAQMGLEVLGSQGGHIFLPEPHFGPLSTSFLYYQGENRVPSLRQMENELGRYVEGNIGNCLKDFEPFTAKGFQVEADEPKASVAISERDVIFTLEMPVTIERNGERLSKDKFFRAENLKLKRIWETVSAIVASEVETEGMIDLDAIMETYPIVFFPYQEILIGHLTDKSYQFTQTGEYVFLWANVR